jgi:squalene-hopene/tetraprenyl-beta-curcumene cyclase
MKSPLILSLAACLALSSPCAIAAAEIQTNGAAPLRDQSLKNELQHAIERGLAWQTKSQDPAGHWSQAEYPALTSLVLTGFMGEPSGKFKANPPAHVVKGYQYITGSVQPDGGIYGKDLASYNTAVSIVALVTANKPEYDPIIRRARNFMVQQQADFDQKGSTDNPYDGGIGYGNKYQHSDLSNTVLALEAIHYTKYLKNDESVKDLQLKELNWDAARKFIARCQNLPGSNDQPWASDDPQNKGGFIYFPGDSKAGEMKLDSGKIALRSYGSISYAGLLSYIYADMKKDDPKVQAAFAWLQKNYTLDENPGMGQEGLYYYYHTMAKALTSYGASKLTLSDGKEVDWRHQLALKLLNLQREDGSWVNENGRWWEKDPVLVTAYAVITLEMIYHGL